jgi:hypothetical protein
MLLLEIFSPYQHSGKSFGKGCNPPNRLISIVGASPTKHEKSLTIRAQQSIWVKCPYHKHMGITPSLTGDKKHNVVTNNEKYLSGLTPISTIRMIPIQKNTMSSQVVCSMKMPLNNTSPWVYAPENTIRNHRTNQSSFINLEQTDQVPKYIRANQVPNTTGHAIGTINTTRMKIIFNNTMWSDPRRNTSQQIPMTQKPRQKPGNSKSPIQPGMAPGQKYTLWVHNNYINTLTFIPAQNKLNQKDWSSWEPKTRTMVQINTTKSNQMTLRSSLLHNFSSANDTVRRYRPHRTTGQPNSAMINSRNHPTSRLDYLPLVTAAPTQTSESGKAPTTRNIAQTHSTYIREYAEYRRLYILTIRNALTEIHEDLRTRIRIKALKNNKISWKSS